MSSDLQEIGLQGMRAWALTVVVRRLRFGWGFPAVVTVIALLSCTLLSMLLLLVQNAEQEGVRSSLASLAEADSRIDLDLTRPSVPLADARLAADRGVARALGDAAGLSSTGSAVSDFGAVPSFERALPAFAYFATTDDPASVATLTAGAWPPTGDATEVAGGDQGEAGIPTAVPEQAALQHGLVVGSTFPVDTGTGTSVTARVVGIYRADTGDDFFEADALAGAGDVSGFPKPGVTYFQPIEAVGPLLVTPEALDATAVPIRLLTLAYRPDFQNTGTAELAGLSDRLANADLTTAIGAVAARVQVSTVLPSSLAQVTTGLTVTRSTVTIVAILLVLLAVAALGQAARLFAAARADDRVLARARGGSTIQLFGLASIEAGLIGTIAAVGGPLLGWLLLPVVAQSASPVGGGASRPGTAIWAASGLLSLLFMVVLLAPLLLPSPDEADTPRQRARQSRSSALSRSGLDLGILVVAGILYSQLLQYRSPVRGVGTVSLDPILVAGPSAVLLAGALLAARAVPLIARLLELLAQRSSGMIVTLSSWEFARRTRAATGVVLLLTLSLAVGTFSQSYLATWRQSQLDQAQLAVGAPVVVPADTAGQGAPGSPSGQGSPSVRAAAPADSPGATASPAFRRNGRVAGSWGLDGELPSGPPAVVLGLTENARSLLERDRLAALGGTVIVDGLGESPGRASGVDLPDGTRGVGASVTVTTTSPLPGLVVALRAIVDDGNGLTTLLDLGAVAVDGVPHTVEALLGSDSQNLAAEAAPVFRGPARIVGFQSVFSLADTQTEQPPSVGTDATVTIDSLAALVLSPGSETPAAQPLAATAPDWQAGSNVPRGAAPLLDVTPGSVVMRLKVQGGLTSVGSTFTVVGWAPATVIPAVITDTLAESLSVRQGASLSLVVNDALVAVRVAAVVPFAPGATGGALITGIGPSATATGPPAAIVVDQVALSRALAEAGYAGPFVDEWWVDVAAGSGAAYAAAHPSAAGGVPARSIEGLTASLQNGPLRLASPAALQLAVAAGTVLAVIGFALHTSGSLRARRPELAHLRAVGVSRRQIVAMVAAESALLVTIGVVLGVALGIGLSLLVGPLIGVSPNGAPPLPQAIIVLPWAETATLVAVVAVAVAAFVVPLAALARSLDPARILRGGS